MNQYGVKFLAKRFEGKSADRIREQQRDLIEQLRCATGSQANHRARRRAAQRLERVLGKPPEFGAPYGA